MQIEPTIEMNLDYLANQTRKLDDVLIPGRKKNRQAILEVRKERLLTMLAEAVKNLREMRLKAIRLERENQKLRRQINASVDQKVLDENERLKAQLEEIRAILTDEIPEDYTDEQRLSA